MPTTAPLPYNLFVLHRQPYREDSALVDALSATDGRIRLVANGLRRKRNPVGPLLQPFMPLNASWQLQAELGRLKTLESLSSAAPLLGDPLFAGFYLNELLIRLLPLQAPCGSLFSDYALAVSQLGNGDIEASLRQFEQQLLYELGAGSAAEIFACEQLYAEQWYRFEPELGLLETSPEASAQISAPGWQFAAIAEHDFSAPQVLKLAKRLNRVRLSPFLGNRPLKSRALWQQMRAGK